MFGPSKLRTVIELQLQLRLKLLETHHQLTTQLLPVDPWICVSPWQVTGMLRRPLFWERVDGAHGLCGLPRDLVDTHLLLTYGLPAVVVSLFALLASALHEAAPAGSPRQIDFLRGRGAAGVTPEAAPGTTDSREFDRVLVGILVDQLLGDMEKVIKKMKPNILTIRNPASGATTKLWQRMQGIDDKTSVIFVQVGKQNSPMVIYL